MDPHEGPIRKGRLIPVWNLEHQVSLVVEITESIFTNPSGDSDTWLYVNPTP
jgi:hypothetical protein